MNQSLSVLQKTVRDLGLTVKKSGHREARSDYLNALRAHYSNRDYPDGLPYNELSPMLCYDYVKLKPKEQDALWKDSNGWIAQPKLNGVRAILHFVEGVGVFCHGRKINLSNYRRTEFTHHLLFGGFIPNFTGTVDGELVIAKAVDTRPFTSKGVVTTSPLQSTVAALSLEVGSAKQLQLTQAPLTFHVFDVTNWQHEDLKRKRLCERLPYLKDVEREVQKAGLMTHFQFVPDVSTGKREFYHRIVSQAGEGIVLKSLGSTYIDSGSRPRTGWIKVKHQIEFDCFVSGFEQGTRGEFKNKVGCLIFSIDTELGDHIIAKVTNFPYQFRKRISLYDESTKKVELNQGILGRVGRVTGLEIAQRSYRLNHPRILFWRDDLKRDQCIYSLDDLRRTDSFPLRVVKDAT